MDYNSLHLAKYIVFQWDQRFGVQLYLPDWGAVLWGIAAAISRKAGNQRSAPGGML